MKSSNGSFFERLYRRVRGRRSTRSESVRKTSDKRSSKSLQKGAVSRLNAAVVTEGSVGVHQTTSVDSQDACSIILQDSRACNCSIAVAHNISSNSFPAIMHNRITSSTPNLGSHLQRENSETQKCSYINESSTNSQLRLEGKEVCMLSATDSGLYSEEEGSTSDEEFLEVFIDDYDEAEEESLVDDGWLIPAEEVALDKVVVSNSCETIYSGYWHGNVSIHARYSNNEETYHSILAEVSTLSNIRHENIQLFLGVCHDLHSDYITIILDQVKGQSLHTLIHRQNHKFSFQSLTKIMSQVAQGMEYLHDKGIPHPLLTSQSVTLHYRICISMLSPGSASRGVFNASDLPYLPPEVMQTVSQHSSSFQTGLTCPSSPHSVRGLQSRSGSTSSKLSYRILNPSEWSTPTSPNLRRQIDSNMFLSSGGPLYVSPSRGSCEDLRSEGQCRQRVQLKGDVSVMQTFQANVFSFGTLLYEMLTLEKPFGSSPGNVIIYQVGKGSVHHLNNLRDGKFKQIIRRCWRGDANSRPSFQRLLSTLEQNMSPKSCGLKKSHFSFSVPSQLDKLGHYDSGRGLDL